MGDKISTSVKVILLVLVFGIFLLIYFKSGVQDTQTPPVVPQTASDAGGAVASKTEFAVTPNASQALQAALQTDKPALLEFYGNG